MKKTVVELFAGVGGFRVGLNDVNFDGKKINEKRI
jgi:site-specific DNA-cytosine methylase